MESANDINARLSQARRHQWKRVSGERETRLQRLRTAQQLRLAAEKRVASARQTMIYIRLVILEGECMAFLASGSEPTGASQPGKVAWFQLLISATKVPVAPPSSGISRIRLD